MHVWALGLSCETLAALGSTIPTRRPPERDKKSEIEGGRGKKARNFGPSTVRGPPFGAPLFLVGAPPFRAPSSSSSPSRPHPSGALWGQSHDTHQIQKKDWPKMDLPKMDWPKIGRAKTRMTKNGFTRTRLMPTFGVSAVEHCRPQAKGGWVCVGVCQGVFRVVPGVVPGLTVFQVF